MLNTLGKPRLPYHVTLAWCIWKSVCKTPSILWICHPNTTKCQGCTAGLTCEAQLSLSSSMIWLLIFQENYPLFDLLVIRNILEAMLSVATHHKDYFWKVIWSTGKTQLHCPQTCLNWDGITGSLSKSLKCFFKPKQHTFKERMVKSSPCPWLNNSIRKVCSGNSSQATDHCDETIGNPLQRILSLHINSEFRNGEDEIGGWLKLARFKKPSC